VRKTKDDDNVLAARRQGKATLDTLTKLAADNKDVSEALSWFNERIADLTGAGGN
jgi:hypothetical protein